ncbi:Uncharacterised protein [Salmonella enterica subsp. enterica serovar Typhi]|nr:Uncharacterised protein [Salmonella enterica subsp. enterica serovar Typhi]CHW56398.1 Uncharacterised protein [Salmonella enterica subsp. enterica serovar Typhi]CHY70080.1 Uncharacterised protein [Salmonella enterica subsp. enterica serovar Typhi]CQU12460.1 Uncharacterised protein [Salmonella enterica subsp. enterica serovar Typhi]CQW29180.1 Uncharacterised protein [Salmonella enterica subsp. enterica serovar Typhi]
MVYNCLHTVSIHTRDITAICLLTEVPVFLHSFGLADVFLGIRRIQRTRRERTF